MTNKLTKYGIMIIAAVLLVAMAFAGAASAEPVNIGSVEEWNAFADSVNAGDSVNKSRDINITKSFSFNGEEITYLGNYSSVAYSGKIEGNYHTISNFTIHSNNNWVGLIGGYGGNKIANLTISNFSVESTEKYIGGLIGKSGDIELLNVHAEYGSVISHLSSCGILAGVLGGSGGNYVNNCSVSNCLCMIDGNDGAGSIIGQVTTSINMVNCSATNNSISAGSQVGGLIGYAHSKAQAVYMSNCNVSNCIISARSFSIGGLIGKCCTSKGNNFNESQVVNCTLVGVSSDSYNIGGLIGLVGGALPSNLSNGNILKRSAIRGGSYSIATISGSELIFDDDTNVTQIQPIWLNNHTSTTATPKIIIAKSATNPGPEYSDYFNNGIVGDVIPEEAHVVTMLTGYGYGGKYVAYGYVLDTAPTYQIINTSVVNGNVIVSTLQAAGGIKIHVEAVNDSGCHFVNWNVRTVTGDAIPVDSTSISGNFTMPEEDVIADAFFEVNTTNVTVTNNTAEFHNENTTVIQSATGTVCTVLLENVSQVTNATSVNFTAGITIDEIPDISGNTKEQITVFEINATPESLPARFNMTVTFKDEATATADKGKIHFWHFNTTNNEWDTPDLTIAAMVQTGEKVLYTVETYAFSPFGFGIYTPIPPQYTPSSSHNSGYTVILQPGQTAPTQAPTAALTTVPTDKPVTPTVVPTANPTAQPTTTPQTPAPFAGLVLGLGAAAVLLRLRR